MPDPNIPVAPTQNFNFDNVPGADMSFDDLFGSPTEGETSVTTQTTATNGEPSQPAVAPPVQPEPVRSEFAIDAGSSKYKTVEDATKGIREKDTLIENLRQQYIARTGVDPVTQRPVMQQPQVEKNYLNDPAQFTKDLREAVEKGDDAAYAQAQLKLLYDALNPVAPLINGYARQNAIEAVSKEEGLTDFQSFRKSDDFKQVLDKNPLLGQAINTAESDYRLHGQLPELYRVAYWAGQGLKTPDLIRAAQAQATAASVAAQSQPPARTPMQGSTLAPPNGSGQPLTVSTHEGRKAIIAEFERNGVLNTKF